MVLEKILGNKCTNCPNQEHSNLTLSLKGIVLFIQFSTTLYQELSPNRNGHSGLRLLIPNIQIQKTISANETTSLGSLIHKIKNSS